MVFPTGARSDFDFLRHSFLVGKWRYSGHFINYLTSHVWAAIFALALEKPTAQRSNPFHFALIDDSILSLILPRYYRQLILLLQWKNGCR